MSTIIDQQIISYNTKKELYEELREVINKTIDKGITPVDLVGILETIKLELYKNLP